jgi:hypothetical protein
MSHRIKSEIRGAGLLGPIAVLEYRALVPNQPLILTREPTNRVDGNAVIVKTVLGQPCGYLAKEDAAVVSPAMARGVIWLAKVVHPPFARHWAACLLWQERGSERGYRQTALQAGAGAAYLDALFAGRFLTEREDA